MTVRRFKMAAKSKMAADKTIQLCKIPRMDENVQYFV